MVQCEMCGAETSSPRTIKVEGAELDVCESCVEFGTEVQTQESSTTSTKYSTGSEGGSSSSSSSGGTSSGRSGSSPSGGSSGGRPDPFDDMDELAQDYDERIRRARENEELSQADLANELNEKASLIRKLERGETLPSDEVQNELERFLDISLSAEAGTEGESDWESDSATEGTTLGDVVKRKD
ncbi:MAG: putative transcription factor [Halobacteriales archaeon]|jgi:putative transcription factor